MQLKPNLAVLPWGATEAHGYHLPYGTDVVEASGLGELAVQGANERGARCVLLPAVPFGMNHSQLYQIATITMRARTQHALLFDVGDSLLRQGIDRLVVLNFHGGNEFKSIIRDLMLDLPIFIAQVDGWRLADCRDLLDDPSGEHADELETSLMLHLKPQWVDMAAASNGQPALSQLPAFSSTQATWAPRDWQRATADTGIGNPKAATAQKGKAILERLASTLVPVLVELSHAQQGQFPFVIRSK
jgi:creatinine amidohydrolase